MTWWILLCGLCLVVGLRLGAVYGPAFADMPRRLIVWHAAAYRAAWGARSRRRGGRPRIDPELVARIRQVAIENPLWGAPRIHGELLKLGYRVAQSTVSKYMPPRAGRPGQGWQTFLRNHAASIVAIDMLCVPTLTFERLYAFVALAHDRRVILHVEVADHPTAFWLARQITEVFAGTEGPRWLVRDNDGVYGRVFRWRLPALGVRDRPTQPHSPWQNGHVERLIGSIRRECLNHVLILNAAHLRRVLRAYARYYNEDRTHLALAKDAPLSRPIECDGEVISRPVLGGLHHKYGRKGRR